MGEMTGKLLAARKNSSRHGGGMFGGQGKNGPRRSFLTVLLVMSTSVMLRFGMRASECIPFGIQNIKDKVIKKKTLCDYAVVLFQLGLLFGLPKQRGGPVIPDDNKGEGTGTILCKDGDSFVPCPRKLREKVEKEHSSKLGTSVDGEQVNDDVVDEAEEGHWAKKGTMSGSEKKEYELPGQKLRKPDDSRTTKDDSTRFDDGSSGDKGKQNANVFLDEDAGTNSIAAGALLDLLKETEPEAGRPLTVKFMRSRIAAFRKYLIVSRNLKELWNDHFAKSQQRGILIAAGRAGAVLNSYVVMYTLRHGVKSTLPVVIAHYGDAEFKKATRDFFQVVFHDLNFLDLETEEYPDHHVRRGQLYEHVCKILL